MIHLTKELFRTCIEEAFAAGSQHGYDTEVDIYHGNDPDDYDDVLGHLFLTSKNANANTNISKVFNKETHVESK